MKTILVIIFCIASSKCGVLKDHMKQSNIAARYNRFETQLASIVDIFDAESVPVLTLIVIDVTKPEEGQPINIESVTKNYYLQPGMHKWELIFQPSEQSADEIDRIVSIVEETAKTTGRVISKNCKSDDDTIIWEFNINIEVPNQQTSKKYKRDIEFKNDAQITDIEEINSLLSIAENKNGTADGHNCKTTDDVVICQVYIPNDSSRVHKREIESQNNTPPIDEDEIKEKPDIITPAVNTTVIVDENGNSCTAISTVTVDNKVYCLFPTNSADFVGGCPAGTDRAADNTCVPVE